MRSDPRDVEHAGRAQTAGSAEGKPSGRATWLRGRLAQQRGQLGAASERLREAARQLRHAGDLEAAATAELELGNVLIERGRVSEALTWLTAASRLFGELGATAGWCAAELRRGSGLWRVGRIDEAQAVVDAGLERCPAAPGLRSAGLLAAGEVLRRLGDEPAAVARYREALADAVAREDPRSQLAAHLALAEVAQRESGAGSEGDAAVAALCANDDDRDRWTLARGRRAMRDPATLPRAPLGSGPVAVLGDASAALARACADVAVRASDADRLERAFRGHALAAQLAQCASDIELASSEADRARLAHAAWAAANGPACRAALDGDADLARLPRPAVRGIGEPAAAGSATALRRLLSVSRRLLGAGVDRIAEEAIDAAIDLTGAERGFALLRTASGELALAGARGFVAGELAGRPDGSALHEIAVRVAQSGEPATAGADLREPGEPASAGRAGAVLAVPLRGRDAILGSLYIEHRLRAAAFDRAAATVVAELAELVGLALDTARRAGELQRTADASAARCAQLEAELAGRDADTARPQAELRAERVEAQAQDLRLRPAIAAVERVLITAAMDRASGNQTVAARLLGLSRFGLQKKLRRRAEAGHTGDNEGRDEGGDEGRGDDPDDELSG